MGDEGREMQLRMAELKQIPEEKSASLYQQQYCSVSTTVLDCLDSYK